MKRRAALARALAFDAPVLLMDEPFRALDSDTHAAMLALVREAAKDKLLILVTHDMNVAEQADRIIQLEDGKIIRDSGVMER